MYVEFSRNVAGTVLIAPSLLVERRKISEYLITMKYAGATPDPDVLLQTSQDIMQAKEDFALTEEEIADLDDGWPVEKDVDTWMFLTYVGYNAADDLKL